MAASSKRKGKAKAKAAGKIKGSKGPRGSKGGSSKKSKPADDEDGDTDEADVVLGSKAASLHPGAAASVRSHANLVPDDPAAAGTQGYTGDLAKLLISQNGKMFPSIARIIEGVQPKREQGWATASEVLI